MAEAAKKLAAQLEIVPYSAAHKGAWDAFVKDSKTNSFMFYRDFMEYHQHRFTDNSLMFHTEGELVALLPANRADNVVSSHGGLTYGGFLTGASMTGPMMLQIFEGLLASLKSQGVTTFNYKALPHIYHVMPAEEDLYALFRVGAQLKHRTLSTTIDFRAPAKFKELRKRGVKKAEKLGYTWKETSDFAPFWKILSENLEARHKTKPVHSLEEITLLNKRFPNSVRQFVAETGGECHAGITMFETETCAHLQYITASGKGKDEGALDFLTSELIEYYRPRRRYFDFGISTEKGGAILNDGLILQKEGFGGRGTVYDIYSLEIK